MNEDNAYELKWVRFEDILEDSRADLQKKPVDRKFAPWVHSIFSLSFREVRQAFS
jgi:hypothetical protein